MQITNSGSVLQLQEEVWKIQQKVQVEPERQATALARRHQLLSIIARATVEEELNPGSSQRELEQAQDELDTVNGEILVNGRRARALNEMLTEAQTKLSVHRQEEATRARAKWEPKVRRRQAEIKQAFIDAAVEYCASISLLDGIPPSFIDPSTVLKKISYGESVGFIALVTAKSKAMQELS